MKEIIIGEKEANQRLDKFLMKYMNQSPKAFVYKMLRKKRIKYNGKKAYGNEKLISGDIIQLYLSDETINRFQKEKEIKETRQSFLVIYEDENILICNKPLGILVHGSWDKEKDTLMDEILFYLAQKGEYSPSTSIAFTPAICNRLDRNTSGIVIVGKNLMALQGMNQMLKDNKIKKYYLAVVKGIVKNSGVLKGYHKKNKKTNEVKIFKDAIEDSKYVETHYKPLCNNGKYTLLEIEIITGRSHQIRAHLSSIHHPVIGDLKYGNEEVNKYFREKYHLKHQFLHGYKITIEDAVKGLEYLKNLSFRADFPKIYKEICKGENLNLPDYLH